MESSTSEPLACTTIIFMLRGLFSKLQFVYTQFPCCQGTSDLLYDPFWEAVYRTERCGFKVGCSSFSYSLDIIFCIRFWGDFGWQLRLHQSPVDGMVYKVPTPYATVGRSQFFSPRSPCNCLVSKNVYVCKFANLYYCLCLQCDRKSVSWSHIVALYEVDRSPGMVTPKVNFELGPS